MSSNLLHDDKPQANGFDNSTSHEEALRKFRSAASISMSPELFEKLYLSPQNEVKGALRKTFGNPTPFALVGFVLALMPLTCALLGWRGAGSFGVANIAVYFFQGGILMLLGGIFEWVLGNSFPAVVFSSFGCFWFAFGGTLNPSFAAFSSYAPANATSAAEGMATTGFNSSLGFWLLSMGMLTTLYLICSLRTNVVFVVVFLTLTPALFILTGAFWVLAEDYTGNADLANKLFQAAGGCLFVTCMAGWYILAAILLAIIDFPIQIPVGDLSQVIKGKSESMV